MRTISVEEPVYTIKCFMQWICSMKMDWFLVTAYAILVKTWTQLLPMNSSICWSSMAAVLHGISIWCRLVWRQLRNWCLQQNSVNIFTTESVRSVQKKAEKKSSLWTSRMMVSLSADVSQAAETTATSIQREMLSLAYLSTTPVPISVRNHCLNVWNSHYSWHTGMVSHSMTIC